jgi:uncharacterized damage-inducible protein DinB
MICQAAPSQGESMTESEQSIGRFYAGWGTYNHRMVDVVRQLTREQLGIRPAPDGWPIWAIVAHTAGARPYWLCGVLGAPGAETTPFPDPAGGIGWEDDLDTPRDSSELVFALNSTWGVVQSCLDRWTPAMLGDTFTRQMPTGAQTHTRQSVLMRLLTHDAYHCGELSQTLGIHGLPQIDLWGPAPA